MHKIDLIKLYGRKRALVVDEFPDMRAFIRRMLRSFGVEKIDLASDGSDALTRCREYPYDIIICDYNLGEGRNGQQLLEELKFSGVLRRTATFVMVTAESSSNAVLGALESRPDDYLTKPLTQTVLQKRLDRIMLEKLVFEPALQALDSVDYQQAVEHCELIAEEHPPYALSARQLQGEALIADGRYLDAASLYELIIREHPCEWAFLGKVKALMAQGKWSAAKIILLQLAKNGSRTPAVYDALSDVELSLGNTETAGEFLQTAAKISPNGLLRQRKLSDLAQINNDVAVAERALRRVIKLASNSCHDCAENNFSLARFLLKKHEQENKAEPSQLTRECRDIVVRTRKKYGSANVALHIQSDVLEVQASCAEGRQGRAVEAIDSLFQQYCELEEKTAAAGLELTRAYKASGEGKKAAALLKSLSDEFASDPDVQAQIDSLSEEPITAGARRNAARINKVGKMLFEQGEYSKAVRHFYGAVAKYPQNIAIKLNLVLAICKLLNHGGDNAALQSHRDKAHQLLDSVAGLPADSVHSKRYRALAKELAQLERRAA